jgi:hypothetical protein
MIRIETKVYPHSAGIEIATYQEELQGLRNLLSRYVVDLEEKAIREALVSMGWTPPVSQLKEAKALVTFYKDGNNISATTDMDEVLKLPDGEHRAYVGAAVPPEATPEMEQAAEAYWLSHRFSTFTNDPRTWAGVWRAMAAVAPATQQHPALVLNGQGQPQVMGRVAHPHNGSVMVHLNSVGQALPDNTPLFAIQPEKES